jgi:amino acid permease
MTASAIVCFLGVLAVIAIDYLGNVVSLLGSLVGIPIALIYPPLMHNQLVDSSKTTRFLNYSLSLIGFIAAGAASYTTIASWDEGAEG